MRTTSGPAIEHDQSGVARGAHRRPSPCPASARRARSRARRLRRGCRRRPRAGALIVRRPSMNSACRALTPSSTSVVLIDVEHRAGDRAGERIAAVGRAVHADRERARDLGRGQHRADREAAAQALGAGQDVGHDALLHVREQRAGAAHAALDLVEDQQRVVLVAQPARRGRNSGVPGIIPPSPCIGSRITAQMSSPPSSANARFEPGDVVVADVREAGRRSGRSRSRISPGRPRSR